MTAHTHLTREMKPPGECPACDEYHRYVPDQTPWRPEPPPPPSEPGSQWALVLTIGLCLLAGAFAVWVALRMAQALTTTP